jgi:hypothetical protein
MPNYDEMTREELRAYVLEHRDDLAALQALFDRPKPDRAPLRFPFPDTEAEWQRQFDMIRPYLDERSSNS